MLTIIIDGNNLAHRAKHVFSLSNKGKDVSVVYGFIHTLQSYITKFKPDSVVVCWDGGVPEFRRIAVPEYKVNRDHGDADDYANFLRQLHELCDYAFPMMGIVSVRKAGSEADDLMYHACKMFTGDKIIITSDKDLLQCISPTTKVYNPARNTLYDADKFLEDFGIPVNLYLDWKALIGDSSDNIPGVHGIGDKTATKLFNQYGTLTTIVNTALGHPVGDIPVMQEKIKQAILSFGFDRIVKNVLIMALYADRTGARLSLLDAHASFVPADKKRVKSYLMRNAFISLLDSLPAQLSRLTKPELVDTATIRIPVVCNVRRPVL